MGTISILSNTVRPSVDHRLDHTVFGAGTFSWQDPVHSWKAGPVEVMTVEFFFLVENQRMKKNQIFNSLISFVKSG